MKILLTMNIPYVFAHGGANKANRLLAEELAARGHEVQVVVPALGIPARLTVTELVSRLERQGVPVRTRGGALELRLNGVEVHAATEAAHLRGLLVDRIAASAPDWVLVSTEDPSQTLLAAALELGAGRVVYLAHSPTFLPFGPQAFFASPARARLVARAAAIVTCSRFVEGYIRRWGGLEARTLYWPAYGPGPFPDLAGFDAGFVTMINPCEVKGLSVFRQLVAGLPEVAMAAVPTWGTTRDDLADLAGRPNLRLLQAADDIEEILAQTRVLLMPSIWPEGFPLTAVETMARGIPVLASDVEGLKEAKLGTGFVLPVRPIERFEERLDEHLVPVPVIPEQDAGPWREALLRILGDRDLYQRESRAQRQAALAFIESVSAAPFEALLEELAAAPPRRPAVGAAAPPPETPATNLEKMTPQQQALLSLWLRKKAAAQAEEEAAEDGPPPLRPAPRGGPLPLSYAQQRIWFLEQLEPGSPLYNMPSAVRLAGRLDVRTLRRTFAALAERHEALRTTFAAEEGEPVQVVAPAGAVDLPLVDLRALPGPARQAEARRLATAEALRPFDLERGPLLRATLVRQAEDEHALILVLHHLISDGWTFGILVREMAALYEAFSVGRPSPLPPLPVQYADFAVWQRQWLRGERLEAGIAWWRERLAGARPSLDLPTDRPRPAVPSPRSGARFHVLGPPLTAALHDLARREGTSLFMVLLTAWKVLLARHAGQDDVAVGTAIANRNRPEVEGLVGLFVNTLVLRTGLGGEPSFREALARVRDVCLGAYAHQDVPFEKLVEALQPQRNLSHSPLFQVLFVLQNMPAAALELPGLALYPQAQESESAKLDLNLTAVEGRGDCVLTLGFRRDLFDATTAQRLLARLETLLQAVHADPGEAVTRLALLAGAERHQLLWEWSPPPNAVPGDGDSVVARFERWAVRCPDRPALVEGGRRLTFAELRDRARRLAAHLRARGVGPEVRVGVLLPPSLEMVTGVLGVWMAGGAYVGLDAGVPAGRNAYLLEDHPVAVLLTSREALPAAPEGLAAEVLLLDEGWPAIAATPLESTLLEESREASPDQLAYLIFTSGSTGRPKAVGNAGRQLLSYLDAVDEVLQTAEGDGFQLHQTLAVDASLTHLLLPLVRGGTLHLFRTEEIADPESLEARLEREPVDYFKFAPSHFEAVLNAAPRPGRLLPRKLLMLGGEASRRGLLLRLRALTGAVLLNHYGPTETTVGSTCWRADPAWDASLPATVPIGRPLANSTAYVLDRLGQPVPLGVTGELFLGGMGVARGYLGQPALTAERFVPDPWGERPGARLYRTGDLARHLADGRLEFLGRGDQQVKVRGFRVELGEVEAAVARHPGVGAAVARLVEGEGGGRLVAYVVPARGAEIQVDELRADLQRRLPPVLVPSAFVLLDELPRSAHGKLDLRKLPLPGDGPAARPEYVAPRDAVEETLARIWAELLGVPRVSVHDDFFALGGHSLLAAQLAARARRALGAGLPLRWIFELPTVAALAAELRSQTAPPEPRRPALVATSREAHRASRRAAAPGEPR